MTAHHVTTLRAAHQEIAEYAAQLANQDLRLRKWVSEPHNFFRSASDASPRPGGGLSLQFDEAHLQAAEVNSPDFPLFYDAFMADLTVIVRDAIQHALVAKGDVFVGAVLGEARQGRSYFAAKAPVYSQPSSLF